MLRAESVMVPGVIVEAEIAGEVDVDDNLETVVSRSEGDLARAFVVTREGVPAGLIRMADGFKALIPRHAGVPPDPNAVQITTREKCAS